MEQSIYRRAALDKLSWPEQLDQLVRVTGPLGWLGLAAVTVVVASVAWAMAGTIATTVSGSGVILCHGGYRVVATAHGGQLVGFRAAVGDAVIEHQVVARVRQYGPGQLPEQWVFSSCTGRVVEVMAKEGDVVGPGVPLLTVEPLNEPLEAVVFIPLAEAKQIRPSMSVRLSPSTSRPEEYGYLHGTVRSVGGFAATRAGMMYVLNNDGLVDSLRAQGPPEMIVIDLRRDRSTPSGYKWSTAAGPPGPVLGGTLCLAKVTVREDAPIRLVVPKVRSLTGL